MDSPYLRTWKEIAEYLKTSVRTAQRYEGLGMPVRRVPLRLGGVFAVKAELDEWLINGRRSAMVTQTDPPAVPGEAQEA